jgi:hypothetical protein
MDSCLYVDIVFGSNPEHKGPQGFPSPMIWRRFSCSKLYDDAASIKFETLDLIDLVEKQLSQLVELPHLGLFFSLTMRR